MFTIDFLHKLMTQIGHLSRLVWNTLLLVSVHSVNYFLFAFDNGVTILQDIQVEPLTNRYYIMHNGISSKAIRLLALKTVAM